MFKNRGHTACVALPYPSHAGRLNLDPANIRIVPEWPGIVRRRRDRQGISWISYGDMLAGIIFTDAAEIAAHLRAWRQVFAGTKADIVIADYAPGAVLAARDHLPLVNIGDGYTLPPHDMDRFPLLWQGEAPVKHAEDSIAEMISEALAELGVRRLHNYPDMNAADAHATMTIPLLDVYSDERSGGWLGGEPYSLPRVDAASRSGLFATLHEDMQFDMRLIEGIADSGLGGSVMIPNLLRKSRKLLAAAEFQTPDDLQPLNEVLETARLLVHHGGMGTCLAGVAKGVPQLIIHGDLEKWANGKAISGAGAGIALDHRNVTREDVTGAIRVLANDPSYTERALELARENGKFFKNSSLMALAELAEQVLARSHAH
ncbi:MAG: glycosyltransferase [Aestuariivirga sp.]